MHIILNKICEKTTVQLEYGLGTYLHVSKLFSLTQKNSIRTYTFHITFDPNIIKWSFKKT